MLYSECSRHKSVDFVEFNAILSIHFFSSRDSVIKKNDAIFDRRARNLINFFNTSVKLNEFSTYHINVS